MLQLNFHPFPVLETQRLLLRKILEDDAPEILLLRSNQNLMEFIDRPLATTKEDALHLIDIINSGLTGNDAITWAVTIKDAPALIGTVGFWRIQKEHFRAEIGYMLNDSFHRKGIMQEAMAAVLDYGFHTMNLHSVEANVNPLNTASVRLLEKNHFVLEAHFKENYYYNGKFLDSYIYSLLSSGFAAG